MGYETNYVLETNSEFQDEIIDQFLKECDEAAYSLEIDGNCKVSNTWYEHEADMRKLSIKHPDVLFTLSGEGDEAGDLWMKFFKNGKMQHVKGEIRYPEFDEKALK